LFKKEVKGVVHPTSFDHSLFVLNLFEFLSSVEHKRKYFEECWHPNSSWSPLTSIVFFRYTMEVNGDQQLYLCSTEDELEGE